MLGHTTWTSRGKKRREKKTMPITLDSVGYNRRLVANNSSLIPHKGHVGFLSRWESSYTRRRAKDWIDAWLHSGSNALIPIRQPRCIICISRISGISAGTTQRRFWIFTIQPVQDPRFSTFSTLPSMSVHYAALIPCVITGMSAPS